MDIRYSEPEGFLTVPLILDKVFGNVRKEIDAGGAKGTLIARSLRAKQRITRGEASVIDRLVNATLGKKNCRTNQRKTLAARGQPPRIC